MWERCASLRALPRWLGDLVGSACHVVAPSSGARARIALTSRRLRAVDWPAAVLSPSREAGGTWNGFPSRST